MHIINTGKEHVTFVQAPGDPIIRSLDSCEILFRQDVELTDNKKKAQLIIVKKDNPSELISRRVDASTRPAGRAFIHTIDGNFVQGQQILAGVIEDDTAKEVTLFTCMVMDITPNGYLR